MSTFFKDTDLTRQEADRLVSETLKNCDDGELFFESSKNESFVLDDNKIKNTSYNIIDNISSMPVGNSIWFDHSKRNV